MDTEDRMDDEVSFFTGMRTKSYKEVRINPKLTDGQKAEVTELLENFRTCLRMFLAWLIWGNIQSIKLTTDESICGKQYALPNAVTACSDSMTLSVFV